MRQWLKRHFQKITSPHLDWVQVEVTTYCNAHCIYCPHSRGEDHWAAKHMPLGLFKELLPSLGNTGLVFLQGWGEPLLNKDLFEMIRLTKDQGNRVGFTTNGMLLNEEVMQRVIDLDLDILGLSFAGATSLTHNRIRRGTDFERIISQLDRLHNIKKERKKAHPSVHLAYLMLKGNFHDLRDFIPLAKKVEASQVIASHLSLIERPDLAEEAIFSDQEHADPYVRALRDIERSASEMGILFSYSDPVLKETSARCGENVWQSCVISAEGDVSPCIFTDPILCRDKKTGNPPSHIFKGRSFPLIVRSFGNISHESLTEIWQKKEHIAFRALFDPENDSQCQGPPENLPLSCLRCYKRLLGADLM